MSWLSDSERDHARKIGTTERRLRWIAGRALLRRSLWECVGDGQRCYAFRRLPSGQLCADRCPAYFSLAHTGAWAAVAVCREAPVGVDVEPVQRRLVSASSWGRFLSDAELQYVGENAERFLRLWICKESVVKADGRGFYSFGPRSVRLQSLSHQAIALDEDTPFGRPEEWKLADGSADSLLWAVAVRTALPVDVDVAILTLDDLRVSNYGASGSDTTRAAQAGTR